MRPQTCTCVCGDTSMIVIGPIGTWTISCSNCGYRRRRPDTRVPAGIPIVTRRMQCAQEGWGGELLVFHWRWAWQQRGRSVATPCDQFLAVFGCDVILCRRSSTQQVRIEEDQISLYVRNVMCSRHDTSPFVLSVKSKYSKLFA